MKNKVSKAFSLLELSIVILVIGILIAGIVQGTKLYDRFKIQTARQLTQSSPVTLISYLGLWLETSMENSFVNQNNSMQIVNGDTISRWIDKNPQSLTKVTVSQGTSNLRPTYIESGINGIPVVRFFDDFLTSNLTISSTTRNTAFVVAKAQDQNGISGQVTFGYIISASGNRFYHIVSTTNNYRFVFGSPAITFTSSVRSDDNKFHVLASTSSGSSFTSYIDGSSLGSNSYTNGTSTAQVLNIGTLDLSTRADHIFRGDIAEVIIYNKILSAEEISSIHKYLGQKYALRIF